MGAATSSEVSGLVIKDNKRIKQLCGHTNVLEVLLNNICCNLVTLLEVGSFFGAGRQPLLGSPRNRR